MTAETPATAGTVTGTPGQAARHPTDVEAGLITAEQKALSSDQGLDAPTPEQAAYEMWDSLLSCDGPIEWSLCEGDVQAAWKHIAEAAIAAAPQPAPASRSQVRRHAEQRDAPELAAAMVHIVTDPDAHRRHGCPTCLADARPFVTPGPLAPPEQPEIGTARRLLDETRADRDDYAARLKAVDQSWTKLAAERDRLRTLALELIGVLESLETIRPGRARQVAQAR